MKSTKNDELVKQIKRVLSKLDAGIESGEVVDSEVDAIRIEINQIFDDFNIHNAKLEWPPLAFESRGLLSWIKGDEVESRKNLLRAIELKGSVQLYTKSAEGILGNLNEYSIDSRGRVGQGSSAVSRFALGCGILGSLLCLSGNVFGATLAVIAVILGGVSLRTSNRNIAVSGMVLGCIGLIVYAAVLIIVHSNQ